MPRERESGLDPEQAAHGARMRAHLGECIERAGGWLAFDRYMDIALYAPALGYYSAGAHKLGTGGDFTTAPEISALFGACLARHCGEVLERVSGDTVLEIGAGSGRLAADLLRRLERAGRAPVRYSILEISADLRERQRALLAARVPQWLEHITWLDEPPSEPFDGVILANEVLDALPVSRFRWRAAAPGRSAGAGGVPSGRPRGVPGIVEELGVTRRGEDLALEPRPAGTALTEACLRLEAAAGPWPDGYESEWCGRLPAVTQATTRALRRGAALWIDYGLPRKQYYLPERAGGTLLCHRGQRTFDDPLCYAGLADITAWVDFTLLAESARPAGFEVAGFCTQSYLLAGLGIDLEMHALAAGEPARQARLAGEARRLMMPGEMGERFKAMSWTRGVEGPLCGFSLQDLRHTL